MARVIVDKALYRDGRRESCGDLSDELDADAGLRVAPRLPLDRPQGPHDGRARAASTPSSGWACTSSPSRTRSSGRQRAKIELYGRDVFVVLKTLSYIEETSDVETGEIMVHISEHFVLTIRRGELSPLAGVRKELEDDPAKLALGPMAALHAIIDKAVDQYRRDRRRARPRHRRDRGGRVLRRAGLLGRHLPAQARGARGAPGHHADDRPAADAAHQSRAHRVPHDELRLLFRDVDDHLHFVADRMDSYDRLLSDVLSANLAKISVQQNADMRKISAWVAIAAVPTMIAGIYGMNFDYMPELRWHYGYFAVLAVMARGLRGLCGVTFKRVKWLYEPGSGRGEPAGARARRTGPRRARPGRR